jgi:hypothetical protein
VTAALPSPSLTPAALLQQYAADILPIASLKAKSAATLSVTDNRKVPDEGDLRLITAKAITDAYREALPHADFVKVYGNGGSWTYSRYKQTLTTLLPAVRRAADSAAAVAFTEIRKNQAAVASNTEPASTPEPAPKPRPRARTRDNSGENPKPRPTRRPEPTPRPKPPVAAVRSTPKSYTAGSAASSGL